MALNYRCGRKGHCLEYDHDGLAQVVVGVFVACKFITMVCFFLSWFFCRRLQAKEKTKDAENEDVNKEGEGERDGGERAGANEKELFCNIETVMRKWRAFKLGKKACYHLPKHFHLSWIEFSPCNVLSQIHFSVDVAFFRCPWYSSELRDRRGVFEALVLFL